MSARDFYDQLAADYHLVYQDWEAAVERQADALDQLIRSACPQAKTILDCSCGIGTQAIGPARRASSTFCRLAWMPSKSQHGIGRGRTAVG